MSDHRSADFASPLRAIPGTISLRDAADDSWDVIVIGAGPAGCLAARLLADLGRQVLIVEAKAFPRDKVCGGCLNARTLEILSRVGLGQMPSEAGGVPLGQFEMFRLHRRLNLAIPPGVALSRARFDLELLRAATAAGCSVLFEATAAVEAEIISSQRSVHVQRAGEAASLAAGCVICADGLRRSSVRQLPEFPVRVSHRSHVGLGVLLSATEWPRDARNRIPLGTILMALGNTGYVGLARVEDDGLCIAAAVNPAAIKQVGSAPAIITRILKSCELWSPDLIPESGWTGTPPLTSSLQRVASTRLFVVGDTAGYVEPLTGEGIAAALESAWLVAPFVDRAVKNWHDSLAREWQAIYDRSVRRRQRIVRGLSGLLRYPFATEVIMSCALHFPALARPFIQRINDTFVAHPLEKRVSSLH